MYFKDINPYKKYELIKTLHSLSLMEFQFSKRKKKTQNHVWLNEKMIVMADWGKLKTMLIYIKAANHTRQDWALRSPNEGESATGRRARGGKAERSNETKKRIRKDSASGSCYLRRARASYMTPRPGFSSSLHLWPNYPWTHLFPSYFVHLKWIPESGNDISTCPRGLG